MYHKYLRILRLVLEATKKGSITWSNDEEDTYYAQIADMVNWIRFKQPLLNKEDGFGSDIAEVYIVRTLMTFYNGCEGFYIVNEIINVAHPELAGHKQDVLDKLDETIDKLERLQAKNKKRGLTLASFSTIRGGQMYQKHLYILRLMLEATEAGSVVWYQDDEEQTHYAKVADMESLIAFKYPLLTNDDGSDADMAQVDVGSIRITFYNGCEGFELVLDILSAAYQKWSEGKQKMQLKVDQTIYELERLQAKNKS
jgi:hypothetical protein